MMILWEYLNNAGCTQNFLSMVTGIYQVLDGPVLRGMQKPSPDLGKTKVCFYSFLPSFKGFCENCLVCLEESSITMG